MPTARAHDGASLYYEVHDYTDPWRGAPALILQHGFGKTARFWYRLIPYIARHYKVVCPDLRGMGRSLPDFDFDLGMTIPNLVSDIIAIVDDLGLSNVHYAGESLAGLMGFVLVAEYPNRIRTLIPISAPPVVTPEIIQAYCFGYDAWPSAIAALGVVEWSRLANSGRRFPPDTDPLLMEWFALEAGSNGQDAMVAMAGIIAGADASPFLSDIGCPVLGLYPPAGSNVTDEMQRMLIAKIPNMRIVPLPANCHIAWMLEPAATALTMLNFMALHDGILVHE